MSDSRFTHAICDEDWVKLNGDRQPCRVTTGRGDGYYESEACCWCGAPTRGVYVRVDPNAVPCGGATGVHQGEPAPGVHTAPA